MSAEFVIVVPCWFMCPGLGDLFVVSICQRACVRDPGCLSERVVFKSVCFWCLNGKHVVLLFYLVCPMPFPDSRSQWAQRLK